MKQLLLTPAMGKRLIGKAVARHPAVRSAIQNGTVAIVAGTTNSYVAEEILAECEPQQCQHFRRLGFRRGVTVPPGASAPQAEFPGDVVLVQGKWQRSKEVFDFLDEMKSGDVVIKGANAVNLSRRQAAVYIGHPMGGTIGASVPAVIGRRVKLLVPVGLEKRVVEDIDVLAAAINDPATQGPRMMPMPGEVLTELEAIALLTGATARLLAGGGIRGAEGSVWLGIDGQPAQVEAAAQLIGSIANEPPCEA